MDNYTILGVHGSVARVRMFVDDQIIDEDFDLPEFIVDRDVFYTIALKNNVEARAQELQNDSKQLADIVASVEAVAVKVRREKDESTLVEQSVKDIQ